MRTESTIAQAFANAPFTPNGWDSALKTMASATGSSRGQLLAVGERHLNFNWVTEIEAEYYEDFVAIEGHRPEVNWRIAATGEPFQLIHEEHYDAVRAVSTNEAYLHHIRRFDAEFGAQVLLLNRPGSFFGLAALHGAHDGRTSAADRRALMGAVPHVLAAIRAQTALEHQGADLLRGSLEAMRVAAVLLDARGTVCAITPAADAVLASGVFRIARGALNAVRSLHDRPLQAMIGRALAMRENVGGDLWVDVRSKPVLVEAFGLPRQDWAFGFAPAVVVTFRTPVSPGASDGARISAALRLTPAEGDIVALLAAGLSRSTIAATRRTSIQTVTSQLRSIFLKCDVRREAELVALAKAIVAMQ